MKKYYICKEGKADKLIMSVHEFLSLFKADLLQFGICYN